MKKDKYQVKYPKYEIVWKDAVHNCDNTTITKDFSPSVVVTLGYLLAEKKNGDILIANELDPDDPMWARHTSVIPHEMIIEMREI